MMEYLKLMRPKHYLKNILVFLPLLCSGQFFNIDNFLITIVGFISFCLLSSAVYCFNDIKDVEIDKKHPIKKYRPIAAGKITKTRAIIFMIILIILSVSLNIYTTWQLSVENCALAIGFELLYLFLNIAYSCGIKNVPILDIVILVSGFLFRISYGAQINLIEISNWLYLTVIVGAFYMGFGKRRNELNKQGENSRSVLKKYNKDFLDKFMYVCLVLAIVFYSLWCIDASTIERIGNNYMIWTIPLLLVIFMKYSLDIEGDSFGDPIEVIFEDKVLMMLILAFAIAVMSIIYIPIIV